MVHILIAEDDFVIATDLSASLEALGYRVQAKVETGEAALEAVGRRTPDLCMLDIELAGEIDGVEVGRRLRASHPDVPFIYLTAQTDQETIDRAKVTEPSAYLVKPFDEQTLRTSIEMALYKHATQTAQQAAKPEESFASADSVFFKVKKRLEKIRFEEVLWVEASDIYAVIRTEKSRFIVSHPLKALEGKFPSERFMRVHRSYLVPLDKIEAIEDNNLLIGGEYVPVGKTYKDALLQRLDIM